ncbi:F-box/kelch-repeat protein At3g06240-like [Prosopis cineraria]|uniref:F-box/kelch-repeat protein At3g06240-like n=1 Tax=Prosopis cineraria TaxID=364024 RepID=UPI00241064ED|nr:F-box/kelch-repeat protein At3g06240-like [Prosopis cineraria]
MKDKVMAEDMPFLPEEIIRDILIRLPAKSLIRFRCVCKQWRNLFKTPSFIQEHLNHTSQNPSLLLQPKDLWLLDCEMQLKKVDNAPLIDSSNTFRVVGSSNGLLLVGICNRFPCFLLWNPATREVRPVPSVTVLSEDSPRNAGFGFSPILNDYKIVVPYDSSYLYDVLPVAVYSLRSGSWKKVECGIKNIGIRSGSITVNGSMYWFGFLWKENTGNYNDGIVSFDIANEVFKWIPIPDWSTSFTSLTVHENKLAVLSSPFTEDLSELWVMEDGTGVSWAKKYSNHLFPSLVRPVAMWRNQIVYDFIITENEHPDQEPIVEEKVALLNISTNQLKTFDISKCEDGCRWIFTYTESLVPIGGNKLCVLFVE